jgi:transcriptional regulator with XRE-family HTH domain
MRLDHEKVRWHRDRLGWTLDELAEKAKVAKGTVLRAEHGEDIRPGSGRRIAQAFSVEIPDLIPEKPGAISPKASAPLSFSRWLEERFGHSYLALSEEEIEELFEGLSGREDEAERKRELFSAITAEYLATTKTLDLPSEERVLVRGHHKDAANKWWLAATASGLAEGVTEEFERSIKEVLAATAERETA